MTVYVVQKQHRWDAYTQDFVPKFDITPAEQYGDLDYLLSPKAAPWHSASVLADLHNKLRYYGPEDYLLLVGNPCIIGWAVAVAAHYNAGSVSLLQWSGREHQYIPVEAKVFDT